MIMEVNHSSANITQPNLPVVIIRASLAVFVLSALLNLSEWSVLKTNLNIDKNKNKSYDIKLDIDWKDTPASNRAVYLTQGIISDISSFIQYNGLLNTIENVNLGSSFDANKPIYIIALDKSNKELKSTTIATKINIIGKKTTRILRISRTANLISRSGRT